MSEGALEPEVTPSPKAPEVKKLSFLIETVDGVRVDVNLAPGLPGFTPEVAKKAIDQADVYALEAQTWITRPGSKDIDLWSPPTMVNYPKDFFEEVMSLYPTEDDHINFSVIMPRVYETKKPLLMLDFMLDVEGAIKTFDESEEIKRRINKAKLQALLTGISVDSFIAGGTLLWLAKQPLKVDRRQFLGMVAAGVAGYAVHPILKEIFTYFPSPTEKVMQVYEKSLKHDFAIDPMANLLGEKYLQEYRKTLPFTLALRTASDVYKLRKTPAEIYLPKGVSREPVSLAWGMGAYHSIAVSMAKLPDEELMEVIQESVTVIGQGNIKRGKEAVKWTLGHYVEDTLYSTRALVYDKEKEGKNDKHGFPLLPWDIKKYEVPELVEFWQE